MNPIISPASVRCGDCDAGMYYGDEPLTFSCQNADCASFGAKYKLTCEQMSEPTKPAESEPEPEPTPSEPTPPAEPQA